MGIFKEMYEQRVLDNSLRGVMLRVFEGQRPVPTFFTVAPIDYRGFRVS